MDLFGIKGLKKENETLVYELDKMEYKLRDYTTRESLGRLISVPRKIGDVLYLLIRREQHPEYDKEIIGLCRSDSIPENNVKIIGITIGGYVIQSNGIYIIPKEQFTDTIICVKTDSPNLFLTMDGAISEMYKCSDKSKYRTDPFVELKFENICKIP